MKRKIAIVLVLVMFILALGCTKDNDNANKADTKNNNENNINNYYTIKDDSEGDLCAVFFLGYGDEMKDNFDKVVKDYNLPLSLDDTSSYTKVDMNGDEWYLIIPKYNESSISITHISLTDKGDTSKDSEPVTSKQPVLLQCNVSDIIPSSEVVVTYKDQIVTFSPCVSLEDGKIVELDNVYTK